MMMPIRPLRSRSQRASANPSSDRLGNIVVRPGFQPDDAIHRVTRGSDHDDADPATALTQPARQRKPVFAGKPNVEHDKARQLAVDQPAQRRAVLYAVDPELVAGQIVDQHVALRYFVLDHYNVRSIVHSLGSLRCAPAAAPTLPAKTRQRKSGWAEGNLQRGKQGERFQIVALQRSGSTPAA